MEIATLIIHGISAILVAGGLFYAGKQLSLTLQVQKQNHDWNRRNAAQQATLDYPAKVTGAEKLNKALKYSVAKEPIPLATIAEKFEEDEELRIICHRLLNYYESLAVGVEQLVYDETVIKGIITVSKTTLIVLDEKRNQLHGSS